MVDLERVPDKEVNLLLVVAIRSFNLCSFARPFPRFQRKNPIRRWAGDPDGSGSADRALMTAIRTPPLLPRSRSLPI